MMDMDVRKVDESDPESGFYVFDGVLHMGTITASDAQKMADKHNKQLENEQRKTYWRNAMFYLTAAKVAYEEYTPAMKELDRVREALKEPCPVCADREDPSCKDTGLNDCGVNGKVARLTTFFGSFLSGRELIFSF